MDDLDNVDLHADVDGNFGPAVTLLAPLDHQSWQQWRRLHTLRRRLPPGQSR